MDLINPNFWFWYLPINLLFFIPLYLLHIKESSFFPYKNFSKLSVKRKIGYPLYRYNYDPFRVNADFAAAIIFIYFLKSILPFGFASILLVSIFLIGFIYNVYYFSISKIYSIQPNFHNDWSILKIGFEFNYHPNKVRFILLSILVILFLIGLGFLVYFFAQFLLHNSIGWLGVIFLTTVIFINFFLMRRYNPSYYMAVGIACLLYTSPSPRDRTRSRMPSSA